MSPVSAAPRPSHLVPKDESPRRLVTVAHFRGREIPIYARRAASLDEAARLTLRCASNLHRSPPVIPSVVA